MGDLPSFQCFHIVILGLDSAGKTTVLYRLQFNEFVNTVPTKGFNTEKIKVTLGNSKTVTFHFWDVGGQEKLRPLWKSYTRCTDGIVFVVDSVDVERMEEAKTELHKITRISENQGVPVLIVANKQDLRNSLSLTEIEKMLAMTVPPAGRLCVARIKQLGAAQMDQRRLPGPTQALAVLPESKLGAADACQALGELVYPE
uniref:ADP-ribosylation factor-like protein 14 n=1 Tax=Nothoprocta perdicaria TaxID=30464 RepID=A0A8C6ZS53_NOTPE